MLTTKGIKTILTISICLTAIFAYADVIYLHDGSIYLGTVNKVDDKGIVIQTFGDTRIISQSDVMKQEKILGDISTKKVEVVLKDNSVIMGKVKNYDPEIGLLVDTDFGPITISAGAILKLNDIKLRNIMRGYRAAVGIQGGVLIPAGTYGTNYKTGYLFQVYFEHTSVFYNDLYVGLDIGYARIAGKEISELTYDVITVQPYLSYRLGFMRRLSIPVLNEMIPFVKAGGGLALVTMHDDRTGGSDSAEMVTSYRAGGGIDYVHFSPVAIRLLYSYEWIVESSSTFNNMQISIGAGIGF